MNTCCEKCSTISVMGSDIATVCTENATAQIAGGISLSVPVLIASVASTVALVIAFKFIRNAFSKACTANEI